MSAPVDSEVQPVGLSTSDASGLVANASCAPVLKWRLAASRDDVLQRAYELQVADNPAFTGDVVSSSMIERSSPFGAPWPAMPLASRAVAWCRVRVWTDVGVTAWSDPLRLEGSLYADEDWLARPISPVFNVGQATSRPVPLLRRSFAITKPVASARLYTTSLGIHEIWINGGRAGRDLLEPGWTAYRQRLLYTTHDVTDLLREGENVIAAAVGDGWWRGNLTWTGARAVYGETTALLAQLELNHGDGTRTIIATDDSWRGGTGALRMADIYDGCDCNLTCEPDGWRLPGFDDGGWSAVAALPLPRGLEQRSMQPVRVVETLTPALGRREGKITVDCGQNHAGYLRLHVTADGDADIAVRHAEVLEPDGTLHTAALRLARATDTYRVPAGRHVLEPSFTYHGYRHAEIAASPGVRIDRVEACVVSQDLVATGHFACSEPLIDRLHANISWSQRSNFVAVPTDCPQRDERLGWTGDIQVFGPTACTLFDSRAFLESWLADLALEQAPDGQVPSVVPNVIQGHPYEFGGIGWADAATLLPWALHEAYGDRTVLVRQSTSMQAWVDYGTTRLNGEGVWSGDFHLGDWLDPGAPPDRPELATTDRDFIASAYLANSAARLAEAAQLLGNETAARHYAALSDRVAAATWLKWRETAHRTQTGCALAIMFDVAPPAERSAIGSHLAALVEGNGGRIATGFLGTPLVLPALTRTGQVEAAYRLLMNPDAPGWLYQVQHGATTMWERWDAILPDGAIHGGGMAAEDAASMISFNHYAYGSVGTWLYRSVAGIAPAAPGYAEIVFAPQPGGGLTWAEARIETPFGPAGIRWDQSDSGLAIDLIVPAGARGRFLTPENYLQDRNAHFPLGSGRHLFECKRRQ